MRRVRVVAVAVAALACAGAAPSVLAGTRAARATTEELTITVSDGTKLACGLVLPSGNPPVGGWPGLLLFHGLGENHQYMETIANTIAPAGFASLACDARGTGASGGTFDLDGPKDVQDARDLFNWLAARSEVSDTQIGGLGISLGGGVVWNAAAAGVPFKAIVPVTAATNLVSALNPNGVPKTGLLGTLFNYVPGSSWDPTLQQARSDLLAGNVTATVQSAEAARSVRSQLHTLNVPTLMLQGRHDFLLDMDQALAAYRLLAGPKRLYLGDLGHSPAPNPAAEQLTYFGEVVSWFEHYLAGTGSVHGGVVLAHDPWDGSTTSYNGVPATRHVIVNLPGTKKLASNGVATRSTRLPGGPLETFGDGYLTVRYSGANLWGQLVATVAVKGRSTPVTVGAADVSKPAGVLRIPLSNQAVLLPRGKRLVVAVARTGPVYSMPQLPPPSAGITIGRMTLNLSLLKKTVSR